MKKTKSTGPLRTVEKLTLFKGSDLADLCDAAESAIEAGGGFGWIGVPERKTMERYWQGVVLVPDRTLIVARIDGVICGGIQVVRPPANNQAQFFSGQLTGCFVAPWARKQGLGHMLVEKAEETAFADGCLLINLDVRMTQDDAIRLYESLGYLCWGHHPVYARIDNDIVPGKFYYKALVAPDMLKGTVIKGKKKTS